MREQRALVARRRNSLGPDALAKFDRAIESHTSDVRRAYDRVFRVAESPDPGHAVDSLKAAERLAATSAIAAADETGVSTAAKVFAARLLPETRDEATPIDSESIAQLLEKDAQQSLNSPRALTVVRASLRL